MGRSGKDWQQWPVRRRKKGDGNLWGGVRREAAIVDCGGRRPLRGGENMVAEAREEEGEGQR